MSRYRDQNIAIAAALFSILLAWLGWQGRGDIHNYRKIQPGMTLKQVEAILGCPAGKIYLLEGNVQAIGSWKSKLDGRDRWELWIRVFVKFDTGGRALEVSPTWGNDQDDSVPVPYRIRNETNKPDGSDWFHETLTFTDGRRRPVYFSKTNFAQYVVDDRGHRIYNRWFPYDFIAGWEKGSLPVLVDPFEK